MHRSLSRGRRAFPLRRTVARRQGTPVHGGATTLCPPAASPRDMGLNHTVASEIRCEYTQPMSREELIILEKDIKAELAELQAKRNLIIPDDTTTAATLYAELAFIKAAKRQQLAATGAESPGMKEIAELKPEISTL